MIKPRALKKGGTIGVVSPASPSENKSEIIRGCKFCGRCPQAMEICKEQEPAYKEIEKGHFVYCHRC